MLWMLFVPLDAFCISQQTNGTPHASKDLLYPPILFRIKTSGVINWSGSTKTPAFVTLITVNVFWFAFSKYFDLLL